MLDLEPKEVFKIFEEIAAIPHGSNNTKAISDYLVSFAKSHDLKYRQDGSGNVIIWRDGVGDRPVIIQGHMDMVCEKEPSCKKDMSVEGLDLYVEGDRLKAKGTTLGGDDGIAVAMALALLERNDDDLPPIEAVFTVDEEIGMLGASAIDVSDLKGRMMINIDSEQEGVFTVSCAGGVVAKAGIKTTYDDVRGDDRIFGISIGGLIGGHSGIEIHKNRANAIVILGRVLQKAYDEADIRIVNVSGGAKDNAIPVSAYAAVAVNTGKEEGFKSAVASIFKDIALEYATTDKNISISIEEIAKGSVEKTMTEEATEKVIYMLTCMPNGIQRMSPDVDGLVQTSLNMGILTHNEDGITLTFCVRSSVASEKDMLKMRLSRMMSAIGGDVLFEGDYPGWRYKVDSELRDLMKKVYITMHNKEPEIEAVHAGVECGFFADKLPGLDCVSIGPNLFEIHTCRESMDIPSVGRTYRLVTETLKSVAKSK